MPISTGAVERAEFERLLREALANLYDRVALQVSPLTALLPGETGERRTKAELVRETVIAAIEQLRPAEKAPAADAPEWRPYLLLTGRYVDGQSVQELQSRLALSPRQLRREHSRALEAVTDLLWEQVTRAGRAERSADGPAPDFTLNVRPLKVAALLDGVAGMLRQRAASEEITLHLPRLASDAGAPRVLGDRIVLRQVLLTLLNVACDLSEDGEVFVELREDDAFGTLDTTFRLEDPELLAGGRAAAALANAGLWAQRSNGRLEVVSGGPPGLPAESGAVTLRLALPRAGQPLIFAVDDQEIALQMYERYLSRSGVRLVGLRQASSVVDEARRAQPQAIVLDVMMPDMDGWEVLQLLRADALTRDIPVIMCSVWEEPELALSLGATDFLKKPITRNDLLAALARLRLLESEAG